MPTIIDYVLDRMTAQSFVSLYHNSGAFGFAPDVPTEYVGWIGPEDSTLKPAARDAAIAVAPPYGQKLARLLASFWSENLGDAVAWLMPMSHWSYELEFGSHEWMPQMLRDIGIDPEVLRPRATAAAIEFSLHEADQLQTCVERLLQHLASSDFAIAFPGQPVLCTIHHHKQLWWVTSDARIAQSLREIVRSPRR